MYALRLTFSDLLSNAFNIFLNYIKRTRFKEKVEVEILQKIIFNERYRIAK